MATAGYQRLVRDLVEDCGDWFTDERRLADGAMTSALYPYDHLFSPIEINGTRIKNRLVMGPIGNINMADAMGSPGARMLAYFVERARGGVGLITSGMVPVSQNVEATVTEPGGRSIFPRIDGSRTAFPGWRDLAQQIHAHGARFFIQLSPGVGRVD
jgi:2-enoate reductase